MRVLHVSEALGGGITSAMMAMIESTPQIDHHLLARPRADHDTGADIGHAFASVQLLPRNPLRAVLAVRDSVRELYPDIVHAHSSVAGAVVRMAGLDSPRIVYSPHCFAFERRDLTRAQRMTFAAIERVLASRTDLLVAVAPNEIDLALALGHEEVRYAPNRTPGTGTEPVTFARPLHVVTAGRICRQKDWRYFLHVKRYAEAHLGLRATWEWLGGGDPEAERALSAAGVTVSGWLERKDLLPRMARGQVYLHTAAWEAAPISILEAASLGMPLALRSIAALDSLGLPGRCSSVVDLATRIETLQSPAQWQRAQAESLALAHARSAEEQGRRLEEAYESACGRPDRTVVHDVPEPVTAPVARLTVPPTPPAPPADIVPRTARARRGTQAATGAGL